MLILVLNDFNPLLIIVAGDQTIFKLISIFLLNICKCNQIIRPDNYDLVTLEILLLVNTHETKDHPQLQHKQTTGMQYFYIEKY
jgi:hypothetical protein